MNNLRLLLSAAAAVFFSILLSHYNISPNNELADFLVTNGTIYTSDTVLPFADSMVIRNGRILRIGNYISVKVLAGGKTRILNLEGKLVVPGFIDSHVHLIPGGLQMARVQLRGVIQKDQFVNLVRESVSNLQPGSWLQGGGWNNDLWGGEVPIAAWIDGITPHNPVWLTRMDGHMRLANSVALNIARISNNTVDPDGGAVMRSSVGEPTGLLVDSAMKLVVSCILEISIEERREALFRASNHALTRGVTTVVDVGRYFPGASPNLSWEDLSDVYQWADLSGKMKTRVCLFFPMETWKRLDVAIHAIGDRANDIILDLYKTVASKNGMRDRRFRIEHAQHLAMGTAARFGEQRVVASVQPDHLLDDANSATKKLGAERAHGGSYLFQSLLSGNAQLALGSDWPVSDIDPSRSMKTAMKRVPPGWKKAWIPSACISLTSVLKGYTISAAWSCFLEEDVGSLSPGKMADFVVLSVDSWDTFAEDAEASVQATYVGGLKAYCRNCKADDTVK